MSKAKQGAIGPGEFIIDLRNFIAKADDEDTIQVKEIRALLKRVVVNGVVVEDALQEFILDYIRYCSPGGKEPGVSASDIWRHLTSQGINTNLDEVSAVLEGLEAIVAIKAVPGMLTTYIPVVVPQEQMKP